MTSIIEEKLLLLLNGLVKPYDCIFIIFLFKNVELKF